MKKKSSQQVNIIYKTNDLSIFFEIKGNRPLNPQHIRRLVASIKVYGMLQSPIIVNEKMEVIDGQHRLAAAKEVNSEIYFFKIDGGLDEVHTLNLNQKNWTKKDYMEGYAKMGIEPYIKLKEFTEKNREFTLNSCVAMCSNLSTHASFEYAQKYRKGGKDVNLKEVFAEGTWKGRDFKIAQTSADKLKMIKPYYDGYNRNTFVGTMLMLENKFNFNFFEFLSKLKTQSKKMIDCTSREQYKLLIEDIYNYRRRAKINLRY